MRKFIHKMQDLSKKAAELKKTVEAMPTKAAELRQAVVMSAGELQQIRSDVQTSLNGLRANTEDRLLLAMREMNDATYIFEEAGYELVGMDLDLTLTQRLSVHLQKFEEVDSETIRQLGVKQVSETIKAILAGILKAEETAANVELTHLQLDGVIIHIGAIPLIRMCWRSDTLQDAVDEVGSQASPAPVVSAGASMPSTPAFGSFFEPRAASAPASQAGSTIPAAVTRTQTTVDTSAPYSVPQTSPSGGSALDRFKKMPDLSKKY